MATATTSTPVITTPVTITLISSVFASSASLDCVDVENGVPLSTPGPADYSECMPVHLYHRMCIIRVLLFVK